MKASSVRWFYLGIGTVMMLFVGIIYAWSILKQPLSTEMQWSQGALGFNYTLTMACFCLGGIVSGTLAQRVSHKLVLIISAAMAGTGFYAATLVQPGTIWLLYLSYGCLCGLGIGGIYNTVISVVTAWFPDKRATVSGIMMMGFGSSSLLLGSVAGALMERLGWRAIYISIGASIFIICTLSAMIIRKNGPAASQKADQGKGTREPDGYSAQEMMKQISFWKFYLLAILLTAIGSYVISAARDLTVFVGAGSTLAIASTGILSVSNGFGRIASGIVFDRLGWKKSIFTAGVISVVSTVFLLCAVLANSIALLIIGIIVVGLSYGFMPPITSGYISTVYGGRHFPLNFSIANTMIIFASFSATIGGVLVGNSGSYAPVCMMLLAFAVLGVLIILSLIRGKGTATPDAR